MLNDECRFLVVDDEALEDSGTDHSLLAVEIGGGLIDQVGHGSLGEGQDDGHSLQFSTRKLLDFIVDDVVESKGLGDFRDKVGVQPGLVDLSVEQISDGALELGRDGLGLVAHVELGEVVFVGLILSVFVLLLLAGFG